MSRPIPEIRNELLALADLEHCPEDIRNTLIKLESEMYRQPPSRPRAPIRNVSLTEDQQRAVCAYAKAHPGKTVAEIAIVFDTNQGRISEALRRFGV